MFHNNYDCDANTVALYIFKNILKLLHLLKLWGKKSSGEKKLSVYYLAGVLTADCCGMSRQGTMKQ